MKNKAKREALQEYEKTIIAACLTRKMAIAKAEQEFEATKAKAHAKYKEAEEKAGKEVKVS